MKFLKFFLASLLFIPLRVLAQEQTQSSLIFSQIGPLLQVTAQPCQLTQLAWITDVPAGQNIYGCTAAFNRQDPGTWTPLGGGSITSPALNGIAYWNGSTVTTTATGSSGTLCLTSASGAAPVWGSCSGSPAQAFSAITSGNNVNSLTMASGGLLTYAGTGLINANALSGTVLANLATGILMNTTGSGVPSIAVAANFPTLNQSTTGTAANVTGLVMPANGGSGVANTATHTLGTSNQNWATLGTGIVKNTTTTGALTNAAFADIVALFGSCSGTQYLGADGNCHTAIGGGLGDPGANGIIKRTALNVTAIALAADYPTLNQNTTGTAGNVTGIVLPMTGGTGVANSASLTLGSANINLATLGTGIVKNTTVTGALTNALSADIVALFSTCSGTQYLGADGNCHTAAANALADPGTNGVIKRTSLNVTTTATSTDIVSLFTSCVSGQYLGADGACHTLPSSVSSVGLVGTANQIAITGASPITGSGTWTVSIPSNPVLPGNASATGSMASSSTAPDAAVVAACPAASQQFGGPGADFAWCLPAAMTTPLFLAPPNANPANSLLYFPTPLSNLSTATWIGIGSGLTVTGGNLQATAPGAFQVNGTGLTNPATVNFLNAAAFNGLTATFTNPSLGGVQLGFSGTLGNAGLTNSSATVNGQTVTLGGSANVNAGAAAHSAAINEGNGSALVGVALANHATLIGQTSADPISSTIPNCTDSGGNHLNYTQSGDTFSCGTTSSASAGAGVSNATFTTATSVVVPGLGTKQFTYSCFNNANPQAVIPITSGPTISNTAPYDTTFGFSSATGSCSIVSGGISTVNQGVRSIGATFSASDFQSGAAKCVFVYFSGNLKQVEMHSDVAGALSTSNQIDVKTATDTVWASSGPGGATSITASDIPVEGAANFSSDTSLTGWTTAEPGAINVCFVPTIATYSNVAWISISLKTQAN